MRVIIQNVGLYQTMQNDRGLTKKDTENHVQKDEYKAILNDTSISDLYQHFLEPLASVQVPLEQNPAFRKPSVDIPEVPSFRPGSGERRHGSMTIGEAECCSDHPDVLSQNPNHCQGRIS